MERGNFMVFQKMAGSIEKHKELLGQWIGLGLCTP